MRTFCAQKNKPDKKSEDILCTKLMTDRQDDGFVHIINRMLCYVNHISVLRNWPHVLKEGITYIGIGR